jgi:CheY-like chemotaxis protein
MSHEIRTPVNVMLGMNEMILRESDSEQIKSYGLSIHNSGKTLLSLINNILDFSKIESGKLAVVEESYLTADLINDLSLTGAELIEKYGIGFQTKADETLPRALTGDMNNIRQVIVNFLSNAAKYTKQGAVTLSFNKKPGERPVEIILCVSVEDTGIGIKRENIPILFDAFTRIDLLTQRNIEGTGLGLAIAKELTEFMGGRIHVKSEWGVGSVFSVEVPQKISDEAPLGNNPHPDAKKDAVEAGSFIAPGGSVLVVDDSKENLQVVRSLLSRTMLRVDTVLSGEECLEAVREMRYDVILMDYMMPVMDGVETLKRLQAISGFDTPVVVLTANVVVGVRQELLSTGFKEYLSKPFTWRDLEGVLLALLPEELIMAGAARSGDVLPADIKNGFASWLMTYGVVLDDGIRYLGGDVIQYKKLAVFFNENYAPGKKEIEQLYRRKDWERLKFNVHSLKSKARSVGANSLSVTAAKLENLCGLCDGAYIAVILPVMYHEWERARDGLIAFATQFDAALQDAKEAGGSPVRAGRSAGAELLAHAPGSTELLTLLKHNRRPDALDALERLIATINEPEAIRRLQDIWQRVDDIEFREAENLLIDLIGGETDRK